MISSAHVFQHVSIRVMPMQIKHTVKTHNERTLWKEVQLAAENDSKSLGPLLSVISGSVSVVLNMFRHSLNLFLYFSGSNHRFLVFFREDTCYLGSSFDTACYLLVVLRLWSSGFGCKCHVTNHSDIYLHIHTRSYIIRSKVGECYVFYCI